MDAIADSCFLQFFQGEKMSGGIGSVVCVMMGCAGSARAPGVGG